jgi:hypothetical protein
VGAIKKRSPVGRTTQPLAAKAANADPVTFKNERLFIFVEATLGPSLEIRALSLRGDFQKVADTPDQRTSCAPFLQRGIGK